MLFCRAISTSKEFFKDFFLRNRGQHFAQGNNPQTLRTRFGSRCPWICTRHSVQQRDVTTRRIPESDQCTTRGSLPFPLGCTTKSLQSSLWGILGLGSHSAHKTNNLEFIFPFKHSMFWQLPENVWKDVPEDLPILFWNFKPDYKMFVFKSVPRFLSNSNLG